ncbi:protein JINGUBANG [Eucalyptus grandis]|uniref:protein JINGUBANG n=1 Tax=Eucalyptus grandis TaxID=71139 RepID=UPI00192EB273|nr:protein JINGUBANG [Eucalyptus grandis]
MGILPCPLPCSSDATISSEHQSSHYRHLQSESSSSLASQSSLPSVPSLTPQQSQPFDLSPTPVHHCCVATLSAPSSYVSSLALAGKFLYSGSSDGEVRAWDRSLPGSDAGLAALAAVSTSAVKSVVARGDRLFTAHQDQKIRVWKIEADGRYRLVTSLPTLADRFARLFSPKNYVEVRRHKKRTWVHHVDAVSSLALAHDGSVLYSASWDRSFKVWRVSDFRCMESVDRAHDDAINAVVVSRDGHVYTCSADRKIKVWKKEGHQRKHALVATLERHRSAVNALALSEDGCILYSGACDRSILVWEKVQDGGRNRGSEGGSSGEGEHYMVVVGALRGHSKAILCVAVVGDVVCSGSADHTVRVWRRMGEDRSYSCLAVCEGHAKPVKCLAAAADADGGEGSGSGTRYLVYSGGLDCKIKVWRICFGKE